MKKLSKRCEALPLRPMIKLTQNSLDKLTELFTLAGYTIRHEKGNFKSGSCMIEAGKLIVLNKFSPVETRVTFLIDALKKIQPDQNLLDDRRKSFLKEALEFRIEENVEEQTGVTSDSTKSNEETS
ncbi:hypothetical protein BH11BAC1_BH11BAC1_23430 [soil metagenome]